MQLSLRAVRVLNIILLLLTPHRSQPPQPPAVSQVREPQSPLASAVVLHGNQEGFRGFLQFHGRARAPAAGPPAGPAPPPSGLPGPAATRGRYRRGLGGLVRPGEGGGPGRAGEGSARGVRTRTRPPQRLLYWHVRLYGDVHPKIRA